MDAEGDLMCAHCGDSTGELAFECDYCGNSFCPDHRLPEAHDCSHISQARPPTSSDEEPAAFQDLSRGAVTAEEIDLEALRERADTENQPYSVVEVEHTVGTTPDPDPDSSPDVAVDGSIASESDTVVVNEESQEREEISINRTAVLVVLLFLALILVGILLFN